MGGRDTGLLHLGWTVWCFARNAPSVETSQSRFPRAPVPRPPQCTGGFFILWETPASVRVSAEPNVCQTGWNLTSPGHRWQQRCRVCSGEGQLRPCRGAPVAGTQSSQRCTPAGFWAQVQDAPQQSCTHERPGTPLAAGCASAGPRGQREVPPRLRRKGVRSRNNDVGVLNFLNAALS